MTSPPSKSAGGNANELIAPDYMARLLAEASETEVSHLLLDSSSHEADEAELTTTLAGLVRAFGIDPDNWADSYVARSEFRGYADVFMEHKKWLRIDPRPIGEYVVQALLAELDIEGDETDDRSVDIDLALSSGRIVQIRGDGSYWTEYTFPNVGSDDERTLDELMADDEETSDPDVCYRLGFHVVLLAQNDP